MLSLCLLYETCLLLEPHHTFLQQRVCSRTLVGCLRTHMVPFLLQSTCSKDYMHACAVPSAASALALEHRYSHEAVSCI